MDEKLRDSRGQLLEEGDEVVYPGRVGSTLYIRHAEVVEVLPEVQKIRVRPIGPDWGWGKPPRLLKNIDLVTITEKGHKVEFI